MRKNCQASWSGQVHVSRSRTSFRNEGAGAPDLPCLRDLCYPAEVTPRRKARKPIRPKPKPKLIQSLADLTPDPKNARRHTPRNLGVITSSLQEVGAARSIVIDEGGRILAGHGTVEGAGLAGIEKVKVVDADGETLIAVRRSGLTEKQKRRLALADNRASDLSDFDPQILSDLVAADTQALEGLFHDREVRELIEAAELERLEAEAAALEAEQIQQGTYDLAPRIMEEYNYVVLFFDNRLDWLVARQHFGLKLVKDVDRRVKRNKVGLGLVLKGADYLTRILGKDYAVRHSERGAVEQDARRGTPA